MIFVFGSNKAGRHGAGAARYAAENRRAQYGVGEGLTGECYALPTKGYRVESLSLHEIQQAVDRFIKFAEKSPNDEFQVTCVGCGLGGKIHADIAPMFRGAPDNCLFDTAWKPWLDTHETKRRYWGTF